MKTRLIVFAAFVLIASHAFAQAPARPQAPAAPAAPATPPAPAAPAAPATPAAPAVSAVPPPPPPPAPPGPPRREGQPINVKVELNITEDGGTGAPIKKSVTAVVADGYNGFVRQQGIAQESQRAAIRSVPLNLDAFPVILPNGKIRLTCSIQYTSSGTAGSAPVEGRTGTDIKQNLVLNLESGKPLVISQGTDPIGERRVTVEVTATILK
jgi:hypothetical protein